MVISPSHSPVSSFKEDGEINQAGPGGTASGSRALLPAQILSARLGPPGVIHYLLSLIGNDCSDIVTCPQAGGGHRAWATSSAGEQAEGLCCQHSRRDLQRARRTISFSGPRESPSKLKHKKRVQSCESPHPSSAVFLPLPFPILGNI